MNVLYERNVRQIGDVPEVSRLYFTLPTEFFVRLYILLLPYMIYILTSRSNSDDQIKKSEDEHGVGHVRKTASMYTGVWLGN